ncbi:hypothetical protein RFEPED_0754 [Rickettsia felis str. Pedreira]|uniref:Uncharacterized protein n=1 Tax=Rickettsia felis str. Pedreira TaxID=1359196 RepID=A0A0F3MRG3_RICFI|nr:hypothetical protein [Rickettsia felis]KJV58373.1 hypothetical protein RFEPED_0754 [Rickettsia felis str. Pedreira]MDE8612053.1 hypothetical protein [Rickettsia felis]
MQNLNKTINSYSTLQRSLIFKIVETPDIYNKSAMLNLSNDLITNFEELGLKLAGETTENSAKIN